MSPRVPLGLMALACACTFAACGDTRPSASAVHVVSLGDSLALGVQPGLDGRPRITSQGYPRQLARRLRDGGHEVELHELGCSGATSASLLRGGQACSPSGNAPYSGEDARRSQLAYAAGLLSRLHGKRVLVTLNIGTNDIGGCLGEGTLDPGCVEQAGRDVRTNLTQALRTLRGVSPEAPIVVLDLYDPFLGFWPDRPGARSTLARSHAAVNAVNAQIAAAVRETGAVLAPFAETLRQPDGLGALDEREPPAVRAVCANTWMCVQAPRERDIHLRREGHALAAGLIQRVLPAAALAPDREARR